MSYFSNFPAWAKAEREAKTYVPGDYLVVRQEHIKSLMKRWIVHAARQAIKEAPCPTGEDNSRS